MLKTNLRMLDNNSPLNEILLVANPIIKSLVDTFVTPKLLSFKDRFKLKSDKSLPTEENFQEYYYRTFKKLIVVNTLVFRNSQQLLTDIYLPLTIKSANDEKIKAVIDRFPNSLSDRYGNILITDTAGMGKSTVMKIMFFDIIKKGGWVPLFIELRRLNSEKKLIDEIQEQLNSINRKFDSVMLLELLAEGGFMFFLDGYDEITLSDRKSVTKDLQEFISKASNNRFVLTSRPEKTLSSFGNFHEFKIEPLSKVEAFTLLSIYDKQGPVSKLLIEKLQEKGMHSIEEFLTNPLLVSLLYTAFEYKQIIPFKKHLFYRQVYDASFETHDLTKGDSFTHNKKTNLGIDDFHRVMRYVGFMCFKKQKLEFIKDEILAIIAKSNSFCIGINFTESELLEDLLVSVPLFIKDGNYFRWAHKSLQEYFAAQFIYIDLEENKNSFLRSLYVHESVDKFINVLDLFYDMDYKSFRNIIINELLKEFMENYRANRKLLSNRLSENETIERSELSFKIALTVSRTTPQKLKANYRASIDGPFKGKFTAVGKPLLVHCFVENKYCIIELLNRKKNQIIKTQTKDKKTASDWRKLFELIEATMKNSNSFEMHSDKKNLLLDAGQYKTDLNMWRRNWGDFVIDYKKANSLLDEIKKDLTNEAEQTELSEF